MGLYDQAVSRLGSGAANLVPIEQAAEIISAAPAESAALQMFRRVPMSRLQERVPVLSVLPVAYFVTGESGGGFGAGSGLKATTSAAWEGRYLQAEEIACIVPIPEAVLADTQYDIWGELTPLISASIGRALDAAIFFGAGAPASFGQPLVDGAVLAGNTVKVGTASQAQGALAADIANVFAGPEQEGFDVNGAIAKTTLRAAVRNARMTTGQELSEIQVEEWYGQPVNYVLRGLWPGAPGTVGNGTTTVGSPVVTGISSTSALSPGDTITGTGIPAGATIKSVDSATQITLNENATAAGTVALTGDNPIALVGDFTQGILGVRQDITYKVLDQAALFDNTGALIVNLPQQDAVALRLVARFGYQTANVVTYDQPAEASRWPWGVLLG